MESETLSNARSLRVIGQHLRGIGIDTFELDKVGNEYIVWLDRNQPHGKSSTGTRFPKSSSKMGLTHGKIAPPLHFHGAKILGFEVEKQLSRAEAGGMPEPRSLGLRMRVLGQYLDLKGADDFAISWSTDSVKIRFLQKEQSLSPSNLYELGICMYLNRSDDAPQTDGIARLAI